VHQPHASTQAMSTLNAFPMASGGPYCRAVGAGSPPTSAGAWSYVAPLLAIALGIRHRRRDDHTCRMAHTARASSRRAVRVGEFAPRLVRPGVRCARGDRHGASGPRSILRGRRRSIEGPRRFADRSGSSSAWRWGRIGPTGTCSAASTEARCCGPRSPPAQLPSHRSFSAPDCGDASSDWTLLGTGPSRPCIRCPISRLFALHTGHRRARRAAALASGLRRHGGPLLARRAVRHIGLGWATAVLPAFLLLGLLTIRQRPRV